MSWREIFGAEYTQTTETDNCADFEEVKSKLLEALSSARWRLDIKPTEVKGSLAAEYIDEPDYAVVCGACRHFRRINHPNLGHCAEGRPEALAGLWDTSQRSCVKYQATQDGGG